MRRLLNYAVVIGSIYLVLFSLIIPAYGSQKANNISVTDQPWQEVVISVKDLEGIAAFFTEIGKYEVLASVCSLSDNPLNFDNKLAI